LIFIIIWWRQVTFKVRVCSYKESTSSQRGCYSVTGELTCSNQGCSGAGTPLRQIFLSRNGAPLNIVYHSHNADTAAFWQVSSYCKKVTLYTKFGQLVYRKIIEIVSTRCHIYLILTEAPLHPRPRWGAHSAPPDPLAGFNGSYL